MRTLVIGDIHGCSSTLDHLLRLVKPEPADTVVILGDCVDRGPDTRGVIVRLLGLKSFCRLILLKGNHEIMMLESRFDPGWDKDWRGHGGRQTLKSYAPAKENPTHADIPPDHWAFFENEFLDYWETDSHIFVHAGLDPDILLAEQKPLQLFWEFLTCQARPHLSNKTVICGHTSQSSGVPLHLGHTICIDTWAFGGGFLSCLDVGGGIVYQASQSGMKRRLTLRPPV